MSALELILGGWLLVALIMALLWWVQQIRRDAGVVDVAWAGGLALLALIYAVASEGYLPRRLLVGALAGIWGTRLAVYLLYNRVIGKQEDGRYQTLRAHWGPKAPVYFFFFFQAQALLDVVLSLPFLVAMQNPQPTLTGWDYTGVGVWLLAVGGETVADRQLARFRARPESRGRTCREGLWRYSRHPNYFFEWIHWWTYVAIAVGSAYWWVTLTAPALMLFFILKVTGIPPTEEQALASRGEDYRRYQRTTSAFIPWFPKEED